MLSLKQKQSGFTSVELLIVIVIIGILAGLVITTFVGIQARGRDSERQTDLKAIQGQLEAFYADKGYYPNATDLNDSAWRGTNKVTLDTKALADPSNAGNEALLPTAPTSERRYFYQAYSDQTRTAPCATTSGAQCLGYVLTANKESTSGTFEMKNQ